MPYVGWKLPDADRNRLLARFAPAYPTVRAHHVTLAFGVGRGRPLPKETAGRVVGIADDGAGVQALVVEIAGTTRRPDGSTYHVTWSLGAGRAAKESNAVIAARGWTPVEPVDIRLEPRFFPS
ncbi:hypothetical protein [Azospirillum sp.]|uniref:hypothetical protein n=1 Tax=Azospirillum sp. TaxID=34012 RepID=UPI002D727298|nr:hypothetical protein [Azospirillum sp.]HYD68854.1 hypothetical protein [Azospirillum sp.]